MARLATIGYEVAVPVNAAISPDNPNGGTVNGPVARDTTNQRTGSGCVVFAGGTPTYYGLFTPSASKTYFIRAYLKFTGSFQATKVLGTGGNQGVTVDVTSGGVLRLMNGVAVTQIGSDSAAMTLGVWYRVELKIVLNASTQVTDVELRLDGVTVASATGLALTSAVAYLLGMQTGSAMSVYADDVAINDSTGSVNNSWPGDGKVVWLYPVSDNAIGTGWTLGTGTAISSNTGAIATDNIPPTGVADLTAGSDGKQIRNATANANSNYDANLRSYTGAGVSASDVINALIPWVCTAAPVSTQAKAGTIGISSNPVIANVNLGAGGTAGAFWSGAAGGTYPTGWKWSPGTITEQPSVTKGSSPVARITQVTSSTRIAVVCSIGMYADYTPTVYVKTGSGISPRSGGGAAQYPIKKSGGGASPPLSPPPTLDNFNRADENPVAGGWGGAIGGGAATLKVASNLLQAASANGTAYWNTVFAADQNVKIKAVTNTNLTRLYLRLQNPGTSSYDGYMALYDAVGETLSIWRIIAGSSTSIASFTGSFSLNDVFEFSAIGRVLTIWINGLSYLTYTDNSGSAVLTAGYVGVGCDLTSETYDDFGASQTGGGSTHTGSGAKSFTSGGGGPVTYVDTGSGISSFAGGGADSFNATETGAGISSRTGGGVKSFVPAETGNGISPSTGGGVDSFQPAETGIVISTRTANGPDAFTAAETGAGISSRTSLGADATTWADTGIGISPHTGGGVEVYVPPGGITYTKTGVGISPRAGGGTKVIGGSPYFQAVMADGPSLLWELAEGSGTSAADATGNGNTGTYKGTPTLGQTGPITAITAMLVDAAGDYVHGPSFGPNTNVSVEVFVKIPSAPSGSNGKINLAGLYQGGG